MNNPDLFTTPSHYERKTSDSSTTPSSQLPILWLAGGVILVVVLSGLFALGGRGREMPQPTNQSVVVGVPTPTTPPPTPTPDCVPAASGYLKTILDQERQLKWDVAAENAAAALNDPELCKEDRPILVQKYLTDSLEGLYARPFDPSKEAQEEAVERYQTISEQSRRFGEQFSVDVPPLNPLTVAQRAAQTGKFRLALQAYETESFNTADQSLVRDYISLHFDVGDWWTRNRNDPNFKEGLSYLVASYRLEQKYKTGQAEAWRRLIELLGSDETKWPAPRKTPLL